MKHTLELLFGIVACVSLGFVFGHFEGQKTSYVRCPSVLGAKPLVTINEAGKNSCVYGQSGPGEKTLKVSL